MKKIKYIISKLHSESPVPNQGSDICVTFILCAFVSILLFSGCAENNNELEAFIKSNTGFKVTKAGMYDSADNEAVLVSRDKENKTLTFYNSRINRYYTLNYDGTSKLYDRYGQAKTMEQIAPGSIVDITFLKDKKLLNSLALSPEAWIITEETGFEIDEANSRIYTSMGEYLIADNILLYGEEGLLELMDINPVDTVTIWGNDSMARSISVEKGHGYLRLLNDDIFVGGWIEVGGSKIIRRIQEDMLLAVPEGSFQVVLTNRGNEGKKNVNIIRGKETELDIALLKIEDMTQIGNIIFVLTPEDMEIFLDGARVDTSMPVQAEYGIHQIIARANGYQTLTQYIKVGALNASLAVTLEKSDNSPNTTTKVTPATPTAAGASSAISANTSTNTTNTGEGKLINGYKITIQTPIGAEVYFDGKYVGLAPISVSKTTGSHEIIIRKEGYQTKSYTIAVGEEQRDENYAFSDLLPKEEGVTPTPTTAITPTVTPTPTP